MGAELSWEEVREKWHGVALEHGEPAGLPLPLEDANLVIERTHPLWAAQMLVALQKKGLVTEEGELVESPPPEPPEPTFRVKNTFYSHHTRCWIEIFENVGTKKVKYCMSPEFHHFEKELNTMVCSDAWGVEQENKALKTLSGMLPDFMFNRYLLSGMFLESSKRSGLTYLFRKLRPTVVLTSHRDPEKVEILCCLCMHPIAYYDNSWAGGMCPTDDIIAHLVTMRADEHFYWKKCGQHPPHMPAAGL